MNTAVILYNLGGPCCLPAVKPFLFNLFNDPAIINLPPILRTCLAKLISTTRHKKSSALYAQMNGSSPILAQTYAQAHALSALLDSSYKVFVYMRYSYPTVTDVIEQLELYNPSKVVMLPLYPQYSSTTTGSSMSNWQLEVEKRRFMAPVRYISSYETEPGFIRSYAQLLLTQYHKAQAVGKPIILFSAHGIPKNRIKAGDPYQKHVEASVQAIIETAQLSQADYQICYQSKVGPLEWLEPATEALVAQYAREGRAIIILPVAFVSEHSETLVELDIQYKALALNHGAAGYFRVPTVGTHSLFIEGLKSLVLNATS